MTRRNDNPRKVRTRPHSTQSDVDEKNRKSAKAPRFPTKSPVVSTGSAAQRLSQSDVPLYSLQDAQRVAVGLWDNFAGKSASPPDLALAIGMSPTSSSWRYITGSSIAYGLTIGGWNADQTTLTETGRKVVAPTREGEDLDAKRDAVLKPRILREFLTNYNRAKFPNDVIAENVMVSMGVPRERAKDTLKLIKDNGRYVGFIRDTPTGPFVMIDSPSIPPPVASSIDRDVDSTASRANRVEGEQGVATEEQPRSAGGGSAAPSSSVSSRVFIAHGKNKGVANQLKELLQFGQFEAVVSVERESTAIPVPEKVFEDMRSCAAGVIHVSAEGQYLDQNGLQHDRINDNVLIEIGAAMALFGKKVVLLVEKGVMLPSNLQGLYRCEYEGNRLEYDATMKLLKTFSQFRT
jgi:hypothetical protein